MNYKIGEAVTVANKSEKYHSLFGGCRGVVKIELGHSLWPIYGVKLEDYINDNQAEGLFFFGERDLHTVPCGYKFKNKKNKKTYTQLKIECGIFDSKVKKRKIIPIL